MRIAAIYLGMSLLWIWLSDRVLYWSGYHGEQGYLVSAAKGTFFVVLSASLVYWLVRRDLQIVANANSLLRAVTEGTTDAVFVKDHRGFYLLFNEAAAQLVGKPVADVLGRDDTALFDPSSAQLVMERDRSVMAAGKADTQEEVLSIGKVVRAYLATKAPYRDQEGNVIGTIGISRDITDRKRIEDELRQERDRLTTLAATVPGVLYSYRMGADGSNALPYLSPAVRDLFGFHPDELTGDPNKVREFLHPDDVHRLMARRDESARMMTPLLDEFRVRHPLRGEIWIKMHSTPAREQDGSTIWHGFLIEVTDRHQEEQQLRESEERLRLALAAGQLGIWEWDIVTDAVFWSSEAFQVMGLTPAEFSGVREDFARLVHPDDREVFWNKVTAVLRSEEAFAHEFRIVRPDGTVRWLMNRAEPVRDAAGQAARLVGVVGDITERKLAEEAIRENEDRFRSTFEQAAVGIAHISPEGRFLRVNSRFADITGYSPKELMDCPLQVLAPADDSSTEQECIHQLLEGAVTSFSLERRYLQKDGSPVWVNLTVSLHRTADGAPLHFIWVIEDISRRHQIEDEVHQARQMLRQVLDAVPQGVFWKDRKSRYLGCNRVAAQELGLGSPEEIVGLMDADLPVISPDQAAFFVTKDQEVMDSGTAQFEISEQITLPSLGTVWLDTTKVPLRDASDKVVGVLGTSQNVTERRRTQEALRVAEERSRLAQEAGRIGIFDWDAATGCSVWTPEQEAIYGFQAGGFSGSHSDWSKRIHPEDRSWVLAELDKIVANKLQVNEVEYRIVRPDGKTRWVTNRGRATYGPDGQLKRLIGTTIDITDRKRAEEALRESESQFRTLVECLPDAIYIVANGRIVFCNPAHANLLGLSDPVQVLGTSPFDVIHPDDQGLVRRRMATMQASRKPLPGMAGKVLRQDGRVVPVFVHVTPIRDRGEDAVLVVLHDLTEQKRAEAAIRETEVRFRKVFENAGTGIAITDRDGRFLQCNPAYCELVGYSEEELSLLDFVSLIHPEDLEANLAQVGRLLYGDTPAFEVENRYRRKSGETVWVRKFVSTLPNSQGRPGYLLALVTDITERRRAVQALRESESRFRTLVDFLPDAVYIQREGRVSFCNPACLTLFGATDPSQILGKASLELHPPECHEVIRTNRLAETGGESKIVRLDGLTVPVYLSAVPFTDGQDDAILVVLHDLTNQRQLEEQFRQAQKMEAVGRLAGGVAHDFNNLLTVINGFSEVALMSLPPGTPQRESIAAIREAGERAARLTQQLLAFSRKAIIAPKVLDLNELVADSVKMLRRLIGEDIVLTVVPDPSLPPIKADPGYIEQVIMNLAVNARDAMPLGGKLTLETRGVTLGADDLTKFPDLKPGKYARLTIADTGQGMTEEVKDKIFEPFFTTKGIGKGTGLGLAVVHGAVEQSGGTIRVESEIGRGTTFELHFPAEKETRSGASGSIMRVAPTGNETVLLVEDETAVRDVARIALVMQGYTVLDACNGKEALRLVEKHSGPIHLLVTDVVMPQMGGKQLAEEIRRLRPGLQVLFMSGYTDEAVIRQGIGESRQTFLHKPFTPLTLARQVRTLLDAGK